ncbi:MAG: sugar ABC transporter substrate-binding protein [Chloroflexi bacterium]|nr:sugar ABC transporter substrate-binding protein [Chloroflexota bacterium]
MDGQPTKDQQGKISRRRFLTVAATTVSMAAAGSVLSACQGAGAPASAPAAGVATPSSSQKKDKYKMVFIQQLAHTVPTAWGQGIKETTDIQQNIEYQLLDGQSKADVQLSLLDTSISQGVDAIFLQPIDSVAVGPSLKKARAAGIPVITLNIDATEPHAVHVEMNHYYGAMDIAAKMGEMMGGKGSVAIINAAPGMIIRDQRTNGFVDGMKAKYPNIKVVADQVADWDRKKAQDVFSSILAGNPDIQGVYGVNDSMALGAVDVAKAKGLLGKIVIFGNDGEKDALESIQAGELSGTQYTDVWQQGRYAAAVAIALATGGISAQLFNYQARILMPYVIATKDNVAQIPPEKRW